MTGHDTTVLGTAGGTLLAVSAIPSTASMINTTILALIGVVVSFFASLLLKYLWAKYIIKPTIKKKHG